MTNLMQLGGRWYFNKAYPKELWPVAGSSPFCLALNTDALERGRRTRGLVEQGYWAAVDASRKKLGEVARSRFRGGRRSPSCPAGALIGTRRRTAAIFTSLRQPRAWQTR